jgi:hypothetical protein
MTSQPRSMLTVATSPSCTSASELPAQYCQQKVDTQSSFGSMLVIYPDDGESDSFRNACNVFLFNTAGFYEKTPLNLILLNNQLDAQFFFHVCLFLFSTCFWQQCAHHRENYLYQYDIWYMSLCIDDHLVCRFG